MSKMKREAMKEELELDAQRLEDPVWYEDDDWDPLEIFSLPVGDPGPDQEQLF